MQRKRKPRKMVIRPFSLYLSPYEKAYLSEKANGVPLGTFIKDIILDASVKPRVVRQAFKIADREAFSRVLALLGKSRLAEGLNKLADAAASGSLFVDQYTRSTIERGCDDVRAIRLMLMIAVGMKAKPGWNRPETLSQIFERAVHREWLP